MSRRLIVPKVKYDIERKTQTHARPITRQPKINTATARVIERKLFPWRAILRIIIAAIAVFLLVWVTNSPVFAVRNYAIQGLKTIPESNIKGALPEHGNVLFFPTKQTMAKIHSVSPLISDVAIYREIPSTIRIVVAERTVALDWESDGKHFGLGLDGSVVSENIPNTALPRVVDTTKMPQVRGNIVVTPGFVHFVQNLADLYPQIMGNAIDHLEIADTTFDITVVPTSGPRMLLETTRNAEVQLKSGKTVIDQFKDSIKEYIDMRIPGKAYYK